MNPGPLYRVGLLAVALTSAAAVGAPAATGNQTTRGMADPFFGPAEGGVSARGAQPIASAASAGGKAVVDDDGADCPDATFTTIQAAVNSGAKDIKICPGTYPEDVVIGPNADVKLKGDGAASTRVTGGAAGLGPIIHVLAGSKVDIEKLAVDGGSAMAAGVVYGIRYDEADGKIKDVEVLNIRNASGSSQGIGIRVNSASGAKTKVKVERSLIDNYTRVGILGNGNGVDIHVDKNVIIGPVLPTVHAPNGIQISRGAKGKVKDNLIDNNLSPVPQFGAGSGILLFCAGKVDVHKNSVSDADLGIALGDNADAKVHDNLVQDSVFDAISLQFIGELFGPLGCPLFPSPTRDNDVHKNTLLNSAETGISFANFDPLNPNPPRDNKVRDNRIDGSVDGIHVFVFAGFGQPSDNKIEKNKIDNSTGTDAVDETVGGGTAGTANEWKKNKCSTSSPAGLCT